MLIKFGKISLKSLLFIIAPILSIIQDRLHFYFNPNIFFNSFIIFLSRILNAIFWFILKNKFSSSSKSLPYKTLTDQQTQTQTSQTQPSHSSHHLTPKKKGANQNFFISIKNFFSSDNTSRNNDQPRKTGFSEVELELLSYQKKKDRREINQYKYLILISCLNFISIMSHILSTQNNIKGGINIQKQGLVTLAAGIRIIFIWILSSFVFFLANSYPHRHQVLSFIVITIIIILIYVFTCEEKNNFYIEIILIIIPELLISLTYVFGYKFLLYSDGNVYQLILFTGVIGMILFISIEVILYISIDCRNLDNLKTFYIIFSTICSTNNENEDLNLNENSSESPSPPQTVLSDLRNLNLREWVLFIFYLVFLTTEIAANWLLITYYSVNHFSAVYSILLFFKCIFADNNKKNLIINTIGSFFIIIMSFVYNEIIVLKFWGLDKNTHDEITKRAMNEVKLINEGINFGSTSNINFNENNNSNRNNNNNLIFNDLSNIHGSNNNITGNFGNSNSIYGMSYNSNSNSKDNIYKTLNFNELSSSYLDSGEQYYEYSINS